MAAGAAIVLGSGAVAGASTVSTFEGDLFRLVNHLPSSLEVPVAAVMQAGALGAVPVAAGAALVARRPRLARDLLVAGTAAWLLAKVAKDVVGRARPTGLLAEVVQRGVTQTGLGYPSGHAAVAAALATAAGPFLPRRVRHITWIVVLLVALGRMYVGAHFPADIVGGAALGWMVGAAWHLVVGAPTRHITAEQLTDALHAAGFVIASVAPVSADARGSTPFVAVTRDGHRLFVKALGREERNADLLFKLWRFIAVRGVEDETPFVTPKQEVEHEALLLLLAARAGVRVPGTLAAVQLRSRPAVLVLENVEGRALGDLEAGELTPALLDGIWDQLRRLQRAGIAHRDLRPANIVVDEQARPWLVDFGFAELSASQHRLAQDVAELLVSSALLVGPERAIAAAVGALGPEAVAGAAPLLQPLALPASTRKALRSERDMLSRLRGMVGEQTDSEGVELEHLARVRPMTILGLAGGLFAVHLLLPQVGELHRTLVAVERAHVLWLVAALVTSAGTYVAAAVAQLGTVLPTLSFGRTLWVQVATSFVNRVTPAGLGGVGVSISYLERSGLPGPDAVAASAANTLAGAIVHGALLLALGVAVGRRAMPAVHLPSGWILLVAVVVVLVLAGFALGTPMGRARLLAPIDRSLHTLGRLVRRPLRALEIFGGSFGITALYIGALLFSLRAFGEHLPPASVALAYLGASALAAAAPTPGGLGVVEAGLVAALTALGGQAAPSIAGVLAFRLATFWLPIAPGWVAFRALRRRHVI